LTIRNNYSVLAKEGNLGSIRAPHHILDLRSSELTQHTATLNFKEYSTIISSEDKATRGPSVIEAVYVGDWGSDALGGLIVHVLHNNLALVTVQNGKPIASQEDTRSHASSSLSIGNTSASICQRESNEFITPPIDFTANENIAFLGIMHVVRKEAWTTSDTISLSLLSNPPQTGDWDINTR
jgi:hypothetical protein